MNQKIITFNISHVTQENLSTGFRAKKRLFPDKASKTYCKTRVNCQNFDILHTQNETETNKMSLFESQILFYQRAGTAGVNAINALN